MSPVAESTLSPVALRGVEETLRALARAFRSYQMYLPNNPVRSRSLDEARAAFVELWKHVPQVSVTIAEHAFLVDGQHVYRDEERGAAGLPWLLYRDGLRRLDISEDFEETELATFLEVLHKSRTAPPDDDDLVTMFWVADFKHLQYRHVELMVDFDTLVSESDVAALDASDAQEPIGAQLVESSMPGDGPPPSFVAIDEFEAALHFLDADEISHLQEEVRREYESDGRVQVIAALFDIIEGQDEVECQLEAVDIIDQLVVEALVEGEYGIVAVMLREARATLSRRESFDPLVHSALSSLPVRLSENEVIAQLLQALDGNEHATIAPLIDELFAELRPWAIIPLLAWYSAAAPSPARNGVERAITRIANRNMSELVRLLDHSDVAVVRGAVTMSRLVPSPAQVAPLARLLASVDPALRIDVVAALAAIGSPGALKVLEGAVEDEVRDVRIGALRAITAHKYAAALPRLQSAIQRKTVRNADLSEKMAFFEAFGAICGDPGVPTLDQVLNGRGLLGNRENAEIRACAAHALGMVGSPVAHRALQRSLDAQEVVVRSAVSRALRGAK